MKYTTADYRNNVLYIAPTICSIGIHNNCIICILDENIIACFTELGIFEFNSAVDRKRDISPVVSSQYSIILSYIIIVIIVILCFYT